MAAPYADSQAEDAPSFRENGTPAPSAATVVVRPHDRRGDGNTFARCEGSTEPTAELSTETSTEPSTETSTMVLAPFELAQLREASAERTLDGPERRIELHGNLAQAESLEVCPLDDRPLQLR